MKVKQMKTLPVGTKVKVISDDYDNFKPGVILTISGITRDLYTFKEHALYGLHFDEVEPLEITIRDVVEGDIVIDEDGYETKAIAVGKHGFATTEWGDFSDNDGYWYMWEYVERWGWRIKQDVKEMTVAEIEELIGTKIKIIKEKI